MYQRTSNPHKFQRRWLGFPPQSARNYSMASAVAVDPSSADSYVVAGRCGGLWLTDDVDDMRPTIWHVTPTSIACNLLPLLHASPAVPEETKFGSASAISADSKYIVGSCGVRDSEGNFRSDAVIWGRGSSALSIREILINAGIASLSNVILDDATGISSDGRLVCGYGHDDEWNYFGWVALLPAIPQDPFDWKTVPRKLPNFPIHPLF
jgi:hypothetical protein